MWHYLLTIEFSTGAYECVNISPLFSQSSQPLWQFYFGWIHLVVSGLYFVWLAFIKFVSSKGTADSSTILGFPGDGEKPKTTSEINCHPPKHFFLSNSSSLIVCL